MSPTLAFPPGQRDPLDASPLRTDVEGTRCAAYVIVAVAALITGFVLGLLCAQGAQGGWHSPDADLPHPRSLQR
ncbi:MAG: hypothetical protein ABSH26_00395 [Opitutaceae bacterium]|jgi:hypothetical protein